MLYQVKEKKLWCPPCSPSYPPPCRPLCPPPCRPQVSHHVGHHNVISTLFEGSETLTEWKSESITYGPTYGLTDWPGNILELLAHLKSGRDNGFHLICRVLNCSRENFYLALEKASVRLWQSVRQSNYQHLEVFVGWPQTGWPEKCAVVCSKAWHFGC